jgi:hypothetical protein
VGPGSDPDRPTHQSPAIRRSPRRLVTTDSLTLDAALQQLYRDHDLPADGGESARWFHVRIGPLTLPLPNPPARQRAVFIHDANHVLTGYNARFSDGEMSIAAFEVGAGCGPVWVAWLLNLSLLALGAVIRPRLVLRALARGRRTASLYTRPESRDQLRRMRVAELRRLVQLDTTPLQVRASDVLVLLAWVVPIWVLVAAAVVATARLL